MTSVHIRPLTFTLAAIAFAVSSCSSFADETLTPSWTLPPATAPGTGAPTTAPTSPATPGTTGEESGDGAALDRFVGDGARTAVDRPDDVDGPQVKVLYVVPSFATDRERDRNGEIARMVFWSNEWLAGQNDGYGLRVDTHEGSLDVVHVPFEVTREEWYSWFPDQLAPAAERLRQLGFPVGQGSGSHGDDLYFAIWEAPAGDYFKTGAGYGTCRPTIEALGTGNRLVGMAAAFDDGTPCPLSAAPYPFDGIPADQRAWFGQGARPFIDHTLQAMRYLPGCGYPVTPRDGETYTVPGTDIVETRGGFLRDIVEPHDPLAIRMAEAAPDAVPALDVHRDTYFRIANGPLAGVACNSDVAKHPLWDTRAFPTFALDSVDAGIERSAIDRPDDVTGPQVHAVYVTGPGSPDGGFDTGGQIAGALRQADAFLRARTGAGLRLDTAGGYVDVTHLAVDWTAAEYATGRDCATSPCPDPRGLLEELGRTRGVDPEKVYVFFTETGVVFDRPNCGGSNGGAGMMNLADFRDGTCDLVWRTDDAVDWSIGLHTLHEVFHAIGGVCPQRAVDGGHSGIVGDLMHAQASGPGITLDTAGDTYWGPSAGPACDLSGHPLFTAAANGRPSR